METYAHHGDRAAFKLFESLYHSYLRRLGETWDATTKRVFDVQKKCSESSAEGPGSTEEAQRLYESVRRDYVAAVGAAWDEAQGQYVAAYDEYVRGHRDAWAKLDPAALSPTILSIIGQSAIAAARYASWTIGNWSLIAWTGVPPWALSPERRQAADQ
jgi:hypothetical protein